MKKQSFKLQTALSTRMPAANKRFGVMRGVCSRKVLREFASLSPVRTFAFPRPNAKPPTVRRNRRQSTVENETKK